MSPAFEDINRYRNTTLKVTKLRNERENNCLGKSLRWFCINQIPLLEQLPSPFLFLRANH